MNPRSGIAPVVLALIVWIIGGPACSVRHDQIHLVFDPALNESELALVKGYLNERLDRARINLGFVEEPTATTIIIGPVQGIDSVPFLERLVVGEVQPRAYQMLHPREAPESWGDN